MSLVTGKSQLAVEQRLKTRGALSRAQVSPPGSIDHKAGSELYG